MTGRNGHRNTFAPVTDRPKGGGVSGATYSRLRAVAEERGAGFIVLVDPDRLPLDELSSFCADCAEAGVDAFFLGSSVIFGSSMDAYAAAMRGTTDLPVIGFPGSIGQISGHLDAVLFLSVISGRNPEYLFGQHVHAAPMIRSLNLEAISTGYMLVDSGRMTTAQYMSGSLPLPSNKPDVAAATALAAEMMGMSLLFTDAGSGADSPVPDEIVAAIAQTCSTPLVVGGGLSSPKTVESKVRAGASFVVVGNAIERRVDTGYIAELASAVHVAEPRALR